MSRPPLPQISPYLQIYRSTDLYLQIYRSVLLQLRQRAYVGGGLQPGAALVVVRLLVVTLPPRSTSSAVAGSRLVGSRTVAGVSPRWPGARSGLPCPVPPPAAASATWRGRGLVPIAGWSLGGVGSDRSLRGGGRRGWCEEWARRG
jgi:hypothetical protein